MLRLYGSAKSRALQWSFWQTDRINRQIVNYFMHSRVLPEAERKPETAETAWKETVEALGVLDMALAKSAWLARCWERPAAKRVRAMRE